jgi:hypothetical protein
MDEITAKVFERLEAMKQQYEDLLEAVRVRYDDLQQQIAEQASEINTLRLRVKQLERPKMTNDEALKTFDALKRFDPSLNLVDFAAQYGMSYDALRSARSRRKRKDRNNAT